MLGLSFGEIAIIAIVLIIAVGPDRMPGFLKTIGRTMRQVRKATSDLREKSGIDELMNDVDLNAPLRTPVTKSDLMGKTFERRGMDVAARRQEMPPEGVDVAEMAREKGER